MASRWRNEAGQRIRQAGARVRCDDCPCEVYIGGVEFDVDHTDFAAQSPTRLGTFTGGVEFDVDHTDFDEG